MKPIVLPLKREVFITLSLLDNGLYRLDITGDNRAQDYYIIASSIWLNPDQLIPFIDQIGRLKKLLSLI